VAWDDVPEEFKEAFWDQLEAYNTINHMSEEQIDAAKEAYEAGFTYHHDDYAAYDLSPEEVSIAREDFWDITGFDPSEFDWEEWREAYDEAFG
jgi:DnaJ-domain-containing protein 1